jgi:hypothetical protein
MQVSNNLIAIAVADSLCLFAICHHEFVSQAIIADWR